MNELKVVHTHAQLYDEDVKPVLKEGEALTDGRMYPVSLPSGESAGLTTNVFWCLHYWAQEHQGIMIELGCPGNNLKFSESEIYHSLCALVRRLGYDPDQVISSEMPTGNQTGPWKTSEPEKLRTKSPNRTRRDPHGLSE